MTDERFCHPVSLQELERRWAAVRRASVSMATSYPATVIFPREDLMTLVSHGPMGVERDFGGRDPIWRGVGRWLPTASFPAIDYCIP